MLDTYSRLEGRRLEALSRLFAQNVRIYAQNSGVVWAKNPKAQLATAATRFHNARRENLIVVVAVYNGVGDSRTRGANARPGINPTALRASRACYRMLEQVAGAGASIRRLALDGSYGTS